MGFVLTFRMLLAGMLGLFSANASAQDANSYQLPPTPAQTDAVQGPVVADAPPPRAVIVPPPAPVIIIEPPVVTPSPTQQSTPRRSPTARTTPSAIPTPLPVSPTDDDFSALPPPAIPLPAPSQDMQTEQPVPAQNRDVPWGWIALVLTFAIAAGGWLVWRRRAQSEPSVAAQAPVLQCPKAPLQSAAEPKPTLPPAATKPLLVLDFAAVRMSVSLVNATLSYRMILIADDNIDSVIVRGDMTSAHASRPNEEQLSLIDAPILHRFDHISAGVEVELKGDIRLPLSAITPIRHGNAVLFVPLMRIEVDGKAAGESLKIRTAFVSGLNDPASGQRLRPIRLDHGPRVYSDVGQRALVVPAFA